MVASRSILVLGVPRSGTSAVAGCLYHLGVNMGIGHLQQGNEWNQNGYFEDLRWQKLNKQITGERYGHNEPEAIWRKQAEQYKALAEVCNKQPLWGMKDPRLCFTAQFIWPYLDDCRIVAVYRNPMASATSLVAHSQGNYKGQHGMSLEQAMGLRDLWAEAMEQRLREWDGESITVRYEELLGDTARQVERLARFTFWQTGIVPDYAAAVQFVNPELRHHD